MSWVSQVGLKDVASVNTPLCNSLEHSPPAKNSLREYGDNPTQQTADDEQPTAEYHPPCANICANGLEKRHVDSYPQKSAENQHDSTDHRPQ